MLVMEPAPGGPSVVGTVGGGALEAKLLAACREVMESDTPRTLAFDLSEEKEPELGLVCGGSVEFYLEPVSAPPEVFILGAGHVGKALVHALVPLDFRVVCQDDRQELLVPDRLPGAELVGAALAEAFARHRPNARTSIVIATRSHDLDLEALRLALATGAPYVGMLGSAKKAQKMRAALGSSADLSRFRCPIGIAIGADDPAEIAISIAAELVAARRGHLAAAGVAG